MTNDTNTLNGALTELGENMADNLVAMGVTAQASDGLTTLANKITDIAPSVGGITPVVTIDISKTPSTGDIYEGDTVLITCKVNADYDDESVADIDLHGYLQGATLTIKNNNTTLGTCVSDNNGIATYTISNIAIGSYSITAHFDGTGTDYESATSTALTFTVIEDPYIYVDDCSTDKSSNITGSITYRSGNQPLNISYVTGQYYTLSQTTSNICGSNRELVPPQGLTEIKIEYDMYLDSQYGYGGFLIYKDSNDAINWNYTNNTIFQGKMNNGTYNESSTSQSGWSRKWLHIVMIITNNTMVMSVYDGDTQVYTTTENISSTIWDNIHYAFLNCVNGTFNVKNIIVTKL